MALEDPASVVEIASEKVPSHVWNHGITMFKVGVPIKYIGFYSRIYVSIVLDHEWGLKPMMSWCTPMNYESSLNRSESSPIWGNIGFDTSFPYLSLAMRSLPLNFEDPKFGLIGLVRATIQKRNQAVFYSPNIGAAGKRSLHTSKFGVSEKNPINYRIHGPLENT